MTPERWQRVKQVFQSVMDRDPEDREALLVAACADDPSLRSEVESLIAAHDRPWDFIESPAFDSTDRAIAEGLQSVSLSDSHQAAVGALGMAYAAAGRRAEARRLLDDLLQRSKQSYISGYYIAQIHNALGAADQVFAWLEKVYDEGYGLLPYVKVDPNWDNLRRDPRYTSLMQRIGLDP